MTTKAQKRTFKAEVNEVLDLVVHSLYSKKEIFLRELISNASDAIDKAQYLGLTDKSLVADSPEWGIEIILDKDQKTLAIIDNGIGLTEAEAESNLGTIAQSGTQAFVDALKERQSAGAPEMIGQFGVGFYASFMVAESVTVESLKRGETQAVRWHSEGEDGYTIGPGERTEPGTTITLKLREEHSRFLEEWEVKQLIKRYSDFIAYPIRLASDGKDVDPASEPLNTMRALWQRAKSEVKEEDYNEFYKHLTHDFNNPLSTIHYAVEGLLEFKALLFLPEKPPFDLFMPTSKQGLQLYVRNVFIGADFEELLPDYLRFVKGVVDSSDLPLNVSREMLQDDAVIRKIRGNLVGRILSELEKMKDKEGDKYKAFYQGFGRVLKEGLHSDYDNSDKLKELALFGSDRGDGKLISLREYRDAMPSTQKEIYYLTADNLDQARQSPQLEIFREREIDVLFFTDPIDGWIVERLTEYGGCKLRAINQGDIELGDEKERGKAKKELESETKRFSALLEWLQTRLGDDVEKVRLSNRLVDSVSCLVSEEAAMNPSMLRMMEAMGQEVPKQKYMLELNPAHPLLDSLLARFEAERDDEVFAADAELLFDLALVAEGASPRDPRAFTRTMARRLVKD